jgi:site-specific recombinase XerD
VPIKAFSRWCHTEDLLPRDPFGTVKKPRLPQLERRIVDAAGVRRLLLTYDKSQPEDYRDLAIVKLVISTGIRRVEAVDACLTDLDLKEGTLLVHGKGRKDRRVRISDELAVMLSRWLQVFRPRFLPKCEHVFISRAGTPLDKTSVTHRFANHARLAQLPVRVTLHQLRHFCATSLLSDGVPLEIVSRQLGHSNATVTSSVYSHVAFSKVAEYHALHDPLRSIDAP